MNRNKLKAYAPKARRDFIKAVTDRAGFYGLTKDKIEPITEQGDVAIIGGKPFPRDVAKKRKRLEERIRLEGFEQVMEAMAYTWFNRFVAIRFMELHGYLEHGYGVLSTTNSTNDTNKGKSVSRDYSLTGLPEILVYAEHVDLPGVDREKVVEMKLAGNRDEELYRMLLIAQCNALHKAMPFLFEWIGDATELLLPENLLHSDSLIRKMVNEIPEEEWQEVEIIGWLYQFYISEKKHQVIGKVVKSEDIPAATQLFTPNWIVKYMVQNTIGRQWVATYHNSPLKQQMEYYIEPAEQTPEVQVQLKAITPESLNPEKLTLLDPACGSGHILVEAYDLFKAIYQERGYRAKDIPRLILDKNLYGLEIDDRAAQLAAFALMMKARDDDRRIFENGTRPHVLAIQGTKAMDVEKITDALNAPIVKGKPEPREMLFEEMDEARTPLFSRENLSVQGEIVSDDVAKLNHLFQYGKTFGSLIRVPEDLVESLAAIAERVEDVLAYGEMFGKAAATAILPVVEQARVLAGKYDAVVTNPPYMGSGNFNPTLRAGLGRYFKVTRTDLYAIFMERSTDFMVVNGFMAMITMQSWMFTSSYRALRERIVTDYSIVTLTQLGPRAFDTIAGEIVATTMFCLQNTKPSERATAFIRVTEGDAREKERLLHEESSRFCFSQLNFLRIPGSPMVYWKGTLLIELYEQFPSIGDIALFREGIHTAHNAKFVRDWWEVDLFKFGRNESGYESIDNSFTKWIPYNKGGGCVRWYGKYEHVIAFDKKSRDEMEKLKGHIRPSQSIYFKEGGTWSDIGTKGFGVKYYPNGFLFDAKGPVCVGDDIKVLISGLNSVPFTYLSELLMPTISYKCGTVKTVPFPNEIEKNLAGQIGFTAIEKAIADWDSFEFSWDFTSLPLLHSDYHHPTLKTTYSTLRTHWREMTLEMQGLEEENNRIFIEAYGLQDELTPDVPLPEITLTCNPHYRYSGDKSEEELEALLFVDTIKELISYAIGCMMGRYSLDQPGLIYAHSGNDQFWEIYHQKHNKPAPTKNNNHSYNSCDSWSTFPPDQDGIIPIYDTDWFPDDAANRFIEFISVAWPKEHLEENLKFVAESLGPNLNESPRETIRRYMATGFFKHHMKMYKKRPIYWLFSSGKLRAFQCLVYLHRYNEGTLSRMRTEYVIPLQGKISARIEQLSGDVTATTSTSHRKKLERERDKLVKQQAELQTFDEKLRHYADQRIILDLDDGVKVNYGKFGDLLAEVQAVTGKKKE